MSDCLLLFECILSTWLWPRVGNAPENPQDFFYCPDPLLLLKVDSSSEEELEGADEIEDTEYSSSISSKSVPRFFSSSLCFTNSTKSSVGPQQSMYAMRSPAERVMIAAATVSSQWARVKGEISPINLLSSSITAIEVGKGEKTPMEFRRKRTTSSCVNQQYSKP
nr:hypothetical protein Iba_chr04bCG5140 [Ipomoea batatas]